MGGVDISFVKEQPEEACAALVVLQLPSLEVRRHTAVHNPLHCIRDCSWMSKMVDAGCVSRNYFSKPEIYGRIQFRLEIKTL